MPISGKLILRIIWDGNVVRGVEVKSTRPQAYRLLKGKLTKDAIQLVPLLYSVCGKAQQAAALAATTAALGTELLPDMALEREVICEAMQEHLWRLLLDWPALLGIPQHRQQFIYWHNSLKEIPNGRASAEDFQDQLLQALLGITAKEWKQIDHYMNFEDWQNQGTGLLAPLFLSLNIEENSFDFTEKPMQSELMPNWDARELLKLFEGKFDHQFSAFPQHEGKSLETGALTLCQDSLLVRDVLSKHPGRVQARLIARLVDLLDSAESLMQEKLSGRVQSVSASNSAGLSMVKTARGMLMHFVRIESNTVAQYLTVAPTEWNFHPQGALVNDLIGLCENDATRLINMAKVFVQSLDPCVEYEIEISHA